MPEDHLTRVYQSIKTKDPNLLSGYKPGLNWLIHFPHDKAFEVVWELLQRKGNKNEAKRNFVKCLKVASYDQILSGAKKYRAYKEKTGNEYLMHASTFLNKDDKHWETEYDSKQEDQAHIFTSGE